MMPVSAFCPVCFYEMRYEEHEVEGHGVLEWAYNCDDCELWKCYAYGEYTLHYKDIYINYSWLTPQYAVNMIRAFWYDILKLSKEKDRQLSSWEIGLLWVT